MKNYHFLILFSLLINFPAQVTYSQNPEGNHTFKITGNKRIPGYTEYASQMLVEYDSIRTDHLYILEFRKDGRLATKTNLVFKGEKFNLKDLNSHFSKGELKHDGIRTVYREDESIVSELLYKEDKLQKRTFYYPNGNMQMLISGSEKILNGEYKLWHSNGQLNFSGNYIYNLKNGDFQQFNETGTLIKKGVYYGGKLISGEVVVQDITFEKPDQLAKFGNGDKAFNDSLRIKTSELKMVKDLSEEEAHSINMNMTISKTGNIEKIDILGRSNPNDIEILNAAFSDLSGFIPATVEEVPVSSILNLELTLTHKGLQKTIFGEFTPILEEVDSLTSNVNSIVEEMPEFSGGKKALQSFLSANVRYPMEAAEKGIQGKILVQYIIEADGSISNVKIAHGVHPLLDAEAIRVVKLMPKWIPGRQKGKPVRVSYTFPINFVLQ